jgi:hypothetical protein
MEGNIVVVEGEIDGGLKGEQGLKIGSIQLLLLGDKKRCLMSTRKKTKRMMR